MIEQTPVMQVYIENAGDERIGGFTIPLPTTAEKLRPWLEAIEVDESGEGIVVMDIRSSVRGLQKAICSSMDEGLDLEELNFLAVKVSQLSVDDRDTMPVVLEAGRCCGNVAELINLTQNLGRFNIQPVFSAEEYGKFLVDQAKGETLGAFKQLENSPHVDEQALAAYILKLEICVDHAAYGRAAQKKENGIFTQQGYLTERNDFQENYRSLEDIPKDYRLFTTSEPTFFKAENIDLTVFVAKAHALCGDCLGDAPHNLSTLEARRSSEYLMLLSDRRVIITEAAHAYRYESGPFHDFTVATEFIGAKAFALHVTDVHQHHVMGDAVELDIQALREDILQHCIYPNRIDAVYKSRQQVSFTLEQWDGLGAIDRDHIQSWTRYFEPDSHRTVLRHLEDVREKHQQSGKAVAPDDLLSKLNAAYMDRAENPHPDMLRIPLVSARDTLSLHR